MGLKILNAVTAKGVGPAIKIPVDVVEHTYYTYFESLAATKISALTVNLQGSLTGEDKDTGVISDPAIAIGSTAERVANGAFDYQIDNVSYSKAAVSAGSVFTVAHTIAASKFGIINLYINAAGTIITKVPGADQTAAQSYATAAAAHTAADAIPLTSDVCYIGRILINNNGALWTANTDDLTDASDVTTATFISATSSFKNLSENAFDAAEITDQKSMIHVVNKPVKYVRAYVSALTGTGEISCIYTPVEKNG